jgi:hypothetical protein
MKGEPAETLGLMVNEQDNPADCTEFASVTTSIKLVEPKPVGVPEITPLTAARPIPAGSEPDDRPHIIAGVPPVTVSISEYTTPEVPDGSGHVVLMVGTGFIMTVRLAFALLEPPSDTLIVGVKVPVIDSVPVILQEEPFTELHPLRALGSPELLHVSVPPPQFNAVAVSVGGVCVLV